jgi:hypothetical protein
VRLVGNWMPWRIFGPKREGVPGKLKKEHNGKLDNL